MKLFWTILLFFAVYFYRMLTALLSVMLRKKSTTDGILFLENFPVENAGYQYRAYKWKLEFEKNGQRSEVVTIFEDKDEFDRQFANMPRLLFRAIRRRFRQCLYARRFAAVIVRRELLQFNDYGNLFMEKFLLRIHPNVILDFDDDISAAKCEPRQISSLYGKLLQENGNKFNDSLRLYPRFVVGSDYLKKKVLSENKNIGSNNVTVVPTCVDYAEFPQKKYDQTKTEIVLGWIGGNHNLHYLDMLVGPLNMLAKDFLFRLIVVAGRDYINDNAEFVIENRRWSLETEKDLIRGFDIGLMPIEDNAVGRGKCGFKLLQYMGLGVVGVATDVTINGEIIDNGKNGFLVNSDNSNWYEVLKKTLSLQDKYVEIGDNAKKTVSRKYSFGANAEKYLEFILS